MEQVHKDRIISNYRVLGNEIRFAIKELVQCLCEEQLLSDTMEEDILYNRTPSEKAYRLLQVIQTRGPRAFGVFYQGVCDAKLWKAADLLQPNNAPHGLVATGSSASVPSSDPVEEDEPLPGDWPSQSHRDEVNYLKLNVKQADRGQMISYFKNPKKSGVYDLSQKCKGQVLIINNEKFTNGLSSRHGSSQDVKGLRCVFQAMNFDVRVETDRTKEEMEAILEKECTRDFKDVGCFILIMLSHGARGKVFGINGKAPKEGRQAENYIENEEVLKLFGGADSLKGKPKILIIQACQTDMEDDTNFGSVESDGVEDSQPAEDTFMVLATAEGYSAFRNTLFGSWFIQAFVYVLANFAYKHDLMGLIMKARQLAATQKVQGQHQVCVTRYESLYKKFFFFPGLPRDSS